MLENSPNEETHLFMRVKPDALEHLENIQTSKTHVHIPISLQFIQYFLAFFFFHFFSYIFFRFSFASLELGEGFSFLLDVTTFDEFHPTLWIARAI